MNILNIEHISKIYGDKVIFDDISYGIHEGDKIGIIGINGTGKTTLLRMIAGTEEPDEGQIIRQNGLKITFLTQHPVFPKDATVLAHVEDSIDGADWEVKKDAKDILTKLDLTCFDEKIEHLSGGQKKRIALAKALVNPSDVLILDEPTNHLDNEMASWLEDYLRSYKGVIIMVTHDRYFLDRVTNKILELSHGKLYAYQANYSGFLELKAQREEMEWATERKRQSILRMEIEWAKRGCRARTTKQKARLERLEALKAGKAPTVDQTAQIDSVETRMGKKTIELHNVTKKYGDRKLIDDFTYIVLRNQRLGIIGPNGCGKSTLLKIIAGLIEPDSGRLEIGETIKMGYFAQEVPNMDTKQRVIDYVRDIADYVPTKEGRISASQMLERFLFTPDMQYSQIEKLSGGEKKRLYLLSILISSPNVLILDEITNDIDIPTLTILEDYLETFAGIIIIVSHDRYFLDNMVDRIFAFEDNGKLKQYEGGYTEYLAARGNTAVNVDSSASKNQKTQEEKKKAAEEWKKNRPTKLKFTFKEQKEYETIDDDIAALEEKIENLEEEMNKNASQYSKLAELSKQKEEAEKNLEYKMDRWVYLNDLAEKIANQ